ncbi:hypothetical protein LguiB_030718 [Lonicera macranthoides]
MRVYFIHYSRNKYNCCDNDTTHLKIRLCTTGTSRAQAIEAVEWQPESSRKMQVNLYKGIT